MPAPHATRCRVDSDGPKYGERFNPYGVGHRLHIPTWLACRTELSPGAKLMYGALTFHAGKNGEAYPRLTRIGRMLGCSKRQAMRYVDELRAQGLLKVENRIGRASTYYFLRHPWMNDGTSGDTSVTGQTGDKRGTGDTSVTGTGDTYVTPPVTDMSPINHNGNESSETNKDHARADDSHAMQTSGDKPGKPGKRRAKSKQQPAYTDQDMTNASALLAALKKGAPAMWSDRPEPDLRAWADTFRLIRTQDSRTQEQIDAIIAGLPADAFWSEAITQYKPKMLRGKTRNRDDRFELIYDACVNRRKKHGTHPQLLRTPHHVINSDI